MRAVLLIVSLLFCATLIVDCARILCAFPTPSYSHQIFFQPIWKELALQGHDVVVITSHPLNDSSIKNLREIDISSSKKFTEEAIVNIMLNKKKGVNLMEEIRHVWKSFYDMGEYQIGLPQVQELIKNPNEKFDLLLVEWLLPNFYPLKDLFNCPMIGLNTVGLTIIGHDSVGNPTHPIASPDFLLPFYKDLTLRQRLISTIHTLLTRYHLYYNIFPKWDTVLRKHFGDGIRYITDIITDVDLILVNANLVIGFPRPNNPAVIELSGMHIKPRKSLPKDLKKYLDEANEGVIYFSLGSNIKSHLLHDDEKKLLLETFAELPYKILWKFETDEPLELPTNVWIKEWIPQQDVLAHPNIKLFVTQGGIQSMEEAIFMKVPLVGIPFFADQYSNVARMVRKGLGLSVDLYKSNKEDLKNAILEVINNPTYKQRVEELSSIASDMPESGLKMAIWWIEYVLRHKGAKHLRSAAVDLPFYQYYMLDIAAIFLGATLIAFYIAKKAFNLLKRLICKKCCVKKESSKKKN